MKKEKILNILVEAFEDYTNLFKEISNEIDLKMGEKEQDLKSQLDNLLTYEIEKIRKDISNCVTADDYLSLYKSLEERKEMQKVIPDEIYKLIEQFKKNNTDIYIKKLENIRQMLSYSKTVNLSKIDGYIDSINEKIYLYLNYIVMPYIEYYFKLFEDSLEKLKALTKHEINFKIRCLNNKFHELDKKIKEESKKKITDYKKMEKLLEENNFDLLRNNGRHKVYSDGTHTTVVPQNKNLGVGISNAILKQANLK